jgi:hypothetical protein
MLFCLFGIFGIYRYRTENTDTELPRYRIFFGTDRYLFRLEPNLPQYRSTEPIGSVIPNAQGGSWDVGVDVDGARKTNAELGVELCPARLLVLVVERRPCTSRSALRA